MLRPVSFVNYIVCLIVYVYMKSIVISFLFTSLVVTFKKVHINRMSTVLYMCYC